MNRGEESGVIERWKAAAETGGDRLAKDADGRLIIRGVYFDSLVAFVLQLAGRVVDGEYLDRSVHMLLYVGACHSCLYLTPCVDTQRPSCRCS